MPIDRRSFLHKTGLASLASFIGAKSMGMGRPSSFPATHADPSIAATDEAFWKMVQQSFAPSPIINFNNGGVSPAPTIVAEAMKANYDFSNQAPSYYMWRVLDKGRENIRKDLADLAGCDLNEIALNRNASEGLETVIFGLALQRGDEVVASLQDYPHVVQALRQREHRDGIRINWVDLDLPSEDEDAIVRAYVAAFTPRVKLVNITHVINWNGQVVPVRKIADAAKKLGIEVLVDGAHGFAQLNFKIPDLLADYYATSLHKWLYAPVGSGMLYVRNEKIAQLYPMFASDDPGKSDIRKFEHLGTRPFYIEEAVSKSIEFHKMIGIERKQARLHYLKNYWMDRVAELPNVRLQTSRDARWGCAIGLVAVDGAKPAELENYLFGKYKIHTTTTDKGKLKGVRITPNVYTTIGHVEMLVDGITKFSKGDR